MFLAKEISYVSVGINGDTTIFLRPRRDVVEIDICIGISTQDPANRAKKFASLLPYLMSNMFILAHSSMPTAILFMNRVPRHRSLHLFTS